MSLLIYPDMPARDVSRLTCLAAVAVARAVTTVSGITPFIKWVNDLYIGSKKLAGILTEGSINQDGSLSYAVIGIGVNVHPADRGEYSDIATDIETEGGKPTHRTDLIAEIVREILPMIESDPTPLFREYADRAAPIIGKRVTVKGGQGEFPATVISLEPDCRIKVKTDGGDTLVIGSGEVTVSFKM
jgi:BirA family biotin operon repressor/biotin-[acetyl-CoA-carboxylase] ligase